MSSAPIIRVVFALLNRFLYSKVQRGLANYERNVGTAHHLSNISENLAKRATTGANALTDDNGELWQGTISVGTPAVTYTGLSYP